MNFKRFFFMLPGFAVWLYTFSIQYTPLKHKMYLVMFVLYGIGEGLYRLFRTKEDKDLDEAIQLKQKQLFVKTVETVSNPVPVAEKKIGKTLKSFIDKADSDQSPGDKIRELDSLFKNGVITEEEFKQAKAKILGIAA